MSESLRDQTHVDRFIVWFEESPSRHKAHICAATNEELDLKIQNDD